MRLAIAVPWEVFNAWMLGSATLVGKSRRNAPRRTRVDSLLMAVRQSAVGGGGMVSAVGDCRLGEIPVRCRIHRRTRLGLRLAHGPIVIGINACSASAHSIDAPSLGLQDGRCV